MQHERKHDARRKIELGGLVVKAGLEEETAAVILGLLLEAAEKLNSGSQRRCRTAWKIAGDLAFASTHKNR